MSARSTWLGFVALAGTTVLASYAIGIARAADAEALWGGVDGTLRMVTMGVMALAVVGFFVMVWGVWRIGEFRSLHWPWAPPDGRGVPRLYVATALFLLPSALWLEATLWHLRDPSGLSQMATVGVLALVGAGNLLLVALGWAAYQDGQRAGALVAGGGGALALQTVVNDLVIWTLLFPW